MNHTFCPTCRRNFTRMPHCPGDGSELLPIPRGWPDSGTRADGYELSAPIAAGGMSRIYRGVSLRDSRPVAIKILAPALGRRPHTVERFYREARLSRLLDHPNAIYIETAFMSDTGHHLMVMELLGGQSLESAARRPISWERAVHIATQVSEALGHAHSRRIVHRDVKPANIQLMGTPGPDERVVLIDFGVAYVAADHGFTAPAPGSQRIIGTPAYMSPEQIRGEPLDGRSDLYAVGVVLYELLSGRRPFIGESGVEVCRMHLRDRPQPLVELLPPGSEPPRALLQLVSRLMARNRAERVPGIGALMEALGAISPWPRRRRPNPSRPVRSAEQEAPSLHGVPSVQLEGRRRDAAVTLLHVELEEQGYEELLLPVAPPMPVLECLARWRRELESVGAIFQQPEHRSARAFFGALGTGRTGPDGAELALKALSALEVHVRRTEKDQGLPMTLRAGLVLRSDREAMDAGHGLILGDADAEAAWYLARRAMPGEVFVGARARFAMGDAHPLVPADSVTRPAGAASIAAWRAPCSR